MNINNKNMKKSSYQQVPVVEENLRYVDDIKKKNDTYSSLEVAVAEPVKFVDNNGKRQYRPAGLYRRSRHERRSSCLSFPCVCKCLLVLVAIGFALTTALVASAYFWMKGAVRDFTVATPLEPLPVVQMSDAEFDLFKNRASVFFDQLRLRKVPDQDLVLTQHDVNGVVGRSDYLRGNMYVTFQPNLIKERYSLPTDMLPGGKGRYYVGSDHLKIDGDRVEVEFETAAKHENWFEGPLLYLQLQYLVNPREDLDKNETKTPIELYLEKGRIFGYDAPDDFIAQRKNLLDDLYNGDSDDDDKKDTADLRAILDGIEAVTVEAGKVVIKPRRNRPSPGADTAAENNAESVQRPDEEDEDDAVVAATTTTTAFAAEPTVTATRGYLRKEYGDGADP